MQLCELQLKLYHIHIALGFSVWGGGEVAQHGNHVGNVQDLGHEVVQNGD